MVKRLLEIRKKLGMNQTDFGAVIGVKQGTIAGYENGIRNPSDAVIKSICREFHINEIWLRTGEGEMEALPTDQDAARAFSLMENAADPFMKMISMLIDSYDEADPEEKEVLARFAKRFAEKAKKDQE